MRKLHGLTLLSVAVLSACSKKDPILPGTRESIFPGTTLTYSETEIAKLPLTAFTADSR